MVMRAVFISICIMRHRVKIICKWVGGGVGLALGEVMGRLAGVREASEGLLNARQVCGGEWECTAMTLHREGS